MQRMITISELSSNDFSVLCIGDTAPYHYLNNLKNHKTQLDPDLIIILPDIALKEQEERLAKALQQHCTWLTPVMIFGEQAHARADYHSALLTEATFSQGIREIEKIQLNIQKLSDFVHEGDVQSLSILALAFTRHTVLHARWQPNKPQLFDYPLLCGMDNVSAHLQRLTDLELLLPQPFERLYQCQHCKSSRVTVREECAKCHCSFIEETALVHHYTCGYLAAETAFIRERLLVCPKCNKELRHYGVDYDKPGSHFVCMKCKDSTPDPDIGFICTDCGLHTPGDTISTIDGFHYQLTNQGIHALQTGILPGTTIGSYMEKLPAYYTVKAFVSLTQHQLKTALRYNRPLSGFGIHVDNLNTLETSAGSQTLNKTFVLLSDIIAENLRDTDLLTAQNKTIYILLPETEAEHLSVLCQRLTSAVKKSISTSLSLEFENYAIDDVDELINNLSNGS